MKILRRTVYILLCALAVVAAAVFLRAFYRAPAYADQRQSEITVSADADGRLRCFQSGAACSVNGIVRDRENGCWRYVQNGIVDLDFTGFAEDNGSWWYVENGLVVMDKNGVVPGTVDGSEGLWYVTGGLVMRDYSGVTEESDGGERWYVENGCVNREYSGFARGSRGWWYVADGRVDRSADGLFAGSIEGEESLWYVSEGQVLLSFTGLTEADANGNRTYVHYGRADLSLTGIVSVEGTELYCKDGKVPCEGTMALELDGAAWIVDHGFAVKVETEEQKTFFHALQIAAEITDDSMTQEEKLFACFNYTKKTYFECVPRTPNLAEPGWPVVYADDMFFGAGGNCFSFAAAFAYLARAVGYEEVYCCNSLNHGWTEIDGKIYDPEWSLHNGGFDLFGIEYDSPTGAGYSAGLIGSDQPGMEWMHVKICQDLRGETDI